MLRILFSPVKPNIGSPQAFWRLNIADACAMPISDLAEWVKGLDEPSLAPLLAALQHSLESFAEIDLSWRTPTGSSTSDPAPARRRPDRL